MLSGFGKFGLAAAVFAVVWTTVFLLVGTAFGLRPVVIESGSMSPSIRTGDVVLLRNHADASSAGQVHPGAVITFRQSENSDRLITHRIVTVTDDGSYITRGDANGSPDSDVVDPGDVVGVGRVVVPLIGMPVLWFTTGQWLPLLAALFVLVAAASSSGLIGGFASGRGPDDGSRGSRRDRKRERHGAVGERRSSRRPPASSARGGRPSVSFAMVAAVAGSAAALLGSIVVITMETDAAFGDTTANPGSTLTADVWKGIIDLDGGLGHMCLARSEGFVWCTGLNDKGQLGDNTTTDRSVPVAVQGPGGVGTLTAAVAIAAGSRHTCAVRADGTVWCWGLNDKGQLGDDTTIDSSTPVQLTGPGGIGTFTAAVSIAAGDSHTCAAKADGTVWCWGLNDKGQLGDNTTIDSSSPVQVTGSGGTGFLASVSAIDAGLKHSCAVKADGTVWCWGLNNHGQLGDNTTTDSSSPLQVTGPGGTGALVNATILAAGETHSCSIRSDGTVWCWGRNDKGQLGDNTTTDSSSPVQVAGSGGTGTLTAVSDIAAGFTHSCAIKTDGTAWCWGLNNKGQLGDNTTNDSSSPVQVTGSVGTGTFTGASNAGAGDHFSCAARTDQTMWCWGDNAKGQLADNTTIDRLSPTQTKGGGWTGVFADAVGVVGGDGHSCAVRTDGTAWCWGHNDRGQLGDNTTTDSLIPMQVRGSGGTGILANVSAVDAGLKHSCAVKADGTVWCWGLNSDGQLGDDTTTDSSTPVQVTGSGGTGTFADAVTVAAGDSHTCAVKTDGTAWCWGRNDKGQLGDNTTIDSSTPVQVTGSGGTGTLVDAAIVAVGDSHSCVVKTDATVWCWGLNNESQLGDNTTIDSSTPVQVTGSGGTGTLTDASNVAAGQTHTCAVKVDATVWCWGRNAEGQLGDNTTTDSATPVQVAGPGGVGTFANAATLAAGDSHICAVKTDNTAWCWGRNNKGQLGDNTTTDSSTPVQVTGPGGVGTVNDATSVGAGLEFSCATRAEGTVWCWGENSNGQLGDGTKSNSSAPQQVI